MYFGIIHLLITAVRETSRKFIQFQKKVYICIQIPFIFVTGVADALANNPTVRILNLKMCTHLDEHVFSVIAERLKENLVSYIK